MHAATLSALNVFRHMLKHVWLSEQANTHKYTLGSWYHLFLSLSLWSIESCRNAAHETGSGPLDHWTTRSTHWVCIDYMHTCAKSGCMRTLAICSVIFFWKISVSLTKVCTDLMHMHTKTGCAYSSAQRPITLSRPECLLWLYVCFIWSVDVHSTLMPTGRYSHSVVLRVCLSV